ncbi:MAG: hypothetical protein VXU46_00840 [Planctomycetota bacterium]|nr:hypothetical protein [Planctomycetota bacterium]
MLLQIGVRNIDPVGLGFIGHKPNVKFEEGTEESIRNARTDIAAHLLHWVLLKITPYADTGTLIDWPWGGDKVKQDIDGRIRVVPRYCGQPFDGVGAQQICCVRYTAC